MCFLTSEYLSGTIYWIVNVMEIFYPKKSKCFNNLRVTGCFQLGLVIYSVATVFFPLWVSDSNTYIVANATI